MLNTDIQIPMSATAASRWVDLREQHDVSLQLDCGAVATPVGVITVEVSNDAKNCDFEIETKDGPTNASTNAIKVDYTAKLTVTGTALSNGYDGSGAKASFCSFPLGLPRFARVVYTRTSGGSGDILHARFSARQ